MSVLATMVSLICLCFIFGIVTTASIPKRKVRTTKSAITITTASIPKRKVRTTKSTITITTASIPKRKVRTTKSTITTTTRTTAAKICNTQECANTAAFIKKKMNMSADPCVDFNEYACGRFIAEAVFPEGRTRVSSFDIVSDENNVVLKDIVQYIRRKEPIYLQNMKRLYRSCMNEAKIEKLGVTLYLKDRQFVDDWPTLNQNWKESSFNLNDVIARYEKVYVQPIFTWAVTAHLKDSKKNALYLFQPIFILEPEYFMRPRNDPVIMACQKYLAEVAVVLGADRSVAEQDAKDVIDLKIALSKVKVPKEKFRDLSTVYNPIELVKLNKLYPDLDIPRAFRTAFAAANISLPDNETIINFVPTYIGNISLAIKNFTKRTLQNLFGFTYAIAKVEGLTKKLRDLKLEFDKVQTGKKTESPRWEVCLTMAATTIRMGMSKQYLKRKFTESAKHYINQMINNLENEFTKIIVGNPWMGQATRTEAYKKLTFIKRKIGYPDRDFKRKDIEKKYENYAMLEDNYYANRLLIYKLVYLNEYLKLRKPVDKSEWQMTPYDANAYYSPPTNEIIFPAGFLQPPFFSKTFQHSMNYGGIGAVIGHEITHAFDDTGSQYDADGNVRNWWQKSDRDNFVNRTQCFIDQNSNFYIPDINMTIKGFKLQGEIVADSVGLKASFRAYKTLVGVNGEQPKLPGLNLTQDQLFFLAFAQTECVKYTRERLISQVTTGVHPPGKYRIIGPLQNSEDFAKAYNCPRGSYMNPEKKCDVW